MAALVALRSVLLIPTFISFAFAISLKSIMAEPLSPDHVFDFLEDDPAHDLEDPNMNVEEEHEEDPKEEPKEDPEEDPEEEPEEEPEGGPEEVTRVSHLTPPPLSESSSDSESADKTLWMPPSGSTFEERSSRTRQSEDAATRTRVHMLSRRMDAYDVDLGFIERDVTRTTDHVLSLEEDNHSLRAWVTKRLGGGAVEARPSECIDVVAVYGESRPSEPRGLPDGP
ncbi:hypothetical protein Tco_1372618, partial [Tanacetum coccineum]